MNRKILIAEAGDSHVALLRQALSGVESELIVARSGAECVALLEEREPDIVLIDAELPGGGHEVCRDLKSDPLCDTIPVLMISSRGPESDVEADGVRAHEAGALDYLSSPLRPRMLRAKLEVLFRLRGALRALGEARDAMQKHNSKLERKVQVRTAEVVATRDATVFALAKLAESRDPETGEHLERMCRYTRILGDELSRTGPYTHLIEDSFLEDLVRSCPLHDIGKVGIPDLILLKPGRLTKEEFEVMKRHTIIGAEALDLAMKHSSATFLAMAAEIARCHHEHYDGGGYPAGLQGDQIPLSARIVALADMFDALTSVRIYKEAYPPHLARVLILDERGKHFDPAVVDAFESSYEGFLDVHRRFNSDASSKRILEDSTVVREVVGD